MIQKPRGHQGGGGGVIKNPRIGHKKTQGKGGGHMFLTAQFMNKMYPFSQDYHYNHGLVGTYNPTWQQIRL